MPFSFLLILNFLYLHVLYMSCLNSILLDLSFAGQSLFSNWRIWFTLSRIADIYEFKSAILLFAFYMYCLFCLFLSFMAFFFSWETENHYHTYMQASRAPCSKPHTSKVLEHWSPLWCMGPSGLTVPSGQGSPHSPSPDYKLLQAFSPLINS